MSLEKIDGGYRWGDSGKIYYGEGSQKKAIKQRLAEEYSRTRSNAAVRELINHMEDGDDQSVAYDVYNESFATQKELAIAAINRYMSLAYIPEHERDKIADDDFAAPGRTFPCSTADQVRSAVNLVGHSANPSKTKKRIVEIAKRKGFEHALPESWLGT